MARRSRNRYREMEGMMSKIILADVLVFILYLVCAGFAWHVLFEVCLYRFTVGFTADNPYKEVVSISHVF